MRKDLTNRNSRAIRHVGLFFVVAGIALLVSQRVAAQTTPPVNRSEEPLCFGFVFGLWTPALDWKSAGHGAPVDSSLIPRAPEGRGWAAAERGPQSDSALMLFPIWWPAGVIVDLDRAPNSLRDTVTGRATAIIADGRKTSPTTVVRAWQARCGAARRD